MKAATLAKKPSFFLNRNFTFLWLGQGVSTLGDYVFNVTLILWIGTRIAQRQSWAPLAISGVLMVTFLPSLTIGPFAGVFVDRWNKRQTMLVMDLCRALLNVLLLVLATGRIALPFIPSTQLPVVLLAEILGIVLLMTACSKFFDPSTVAMLGNIVEKDNLTRATGRLQATDGLVTVIGLSLSAPLFFGLGVQYVLLLNALSFLFSFCTILLIRLPETRTEGQAEQKESFIQEFKEGLHFCAHHDDLIPFLLAISLFLIGNGIMNTLNLFFITENLHLPAAAFSYLNAVFGMGTILGAILATQTARWSEPRTMFWLFLLLAGALFLLYATSTSLGMAFVIFFLFAISNAATNTVITPFLLDVTPNAFIGRVFAVLGSVVTLMRILSMALAGYLASTVLATFRAELFGMHLNAINLLFLVAGALTIGAGLSARFNMKPQKSHSH